jgi:hypothetical protein
MGVLFLLFPLKPTARHELKAFQRKVEQDGWFEKWEGIQMEFGHPRGDKFHGLRVGVDNTLPQPPQRVAALGNISSWHSRIRCS